MLTFAFDGRTSVVFRWYSTEASCASWLKRPPHQTRPQMRSLVALLSEPFSVAVRDLLQHEASRLGSGSVPPRLWLSLDGQFH